MEKNEFFGFSKDISPKLLIDKDHTNGVQNFFLILGLIFNDLKGLIFFQKLIEDYYRKPGLSEVSVHAGEYNGLIGQVDRLLIATVAEFFNFIDKNKSVLSTPLFLLLVKKLGRENKGRWNDIVNLRDGASVLSKISRIRSNVVFHYDHSMEELRKGFIDCFFLEGKDLIQHKRAYYSFGNTMENTRIYYSDAAAQEYVRKILVIDRVKVRLAVEDMNHVIQGLLRVYLEYIKK